MEPKISMKSNFQGGKKMKKAIFIMAAALLIGSLALAAGYGRGQMNSQANYGAGATQRMGYMYGVTATSTEAPLRNFVDENEDGICDLCGEDGVPALDGTGKRFGIMGTVGSRMNYGQNGSMRRAIPSESVEMGTAGTFRGRMRDAFSCQMPVRNNMHWRYNPEFGNSVSKP